MNHLRLVRLVPDPEPLRVEELVRPAVEAPPKAEGPGIWGVLFGLLLGAVLLVGVVGVASIVALAAIAIFGG